MLYKYVCVLYVYEHVCVWCLQVCMSGVCICVWYMLYVCIVYVFKNVCVCGECIVASVCVMFKCVCLCAYVCVVCLCVCLCIYVCV